MSDEYDPRVEPFPSAAFDSNMAAVYVRTAVEATAGALAGLVGGAWERDAAGREARVVHQVAETSTLVTFVAAGLGIAVVPEPTAALAVPGVVYVSLVGAPGIDLVAAHRTEDDNPVLVRALGALSAVADG